MKRLILIFCVFLFIVSCRVKLSRTSTNVAESCIEYGKTIIKWDTHPDTNGDLDGFRVYRGDENANLESFELVHDIKEDPTATTLPLASMAKPLNSCKANYLYLTAYSTESLPEDPTKRLESDPSEVVCWGLGCAAAASASGSSSSIVIK